MIKLIEENNIQNIIDNNINIIVMPNYETYYKEKYFGKNYNITTLRKYILNNYNKSLKFTNKIVEYIFMYRAYIKVLKKLKYYQDFFSFSFINDLLNTYEEFKLYELNNTLKISDLKLIYNTYEKLLLDNGYINYLLILNEVDLKNNDYLFLGLETIDKKEEQFFKKLCLNNNIYINLKNYNNKNLINILNDIDNTLNLKYEINNNENTCDYNALNDISDEVNFVLNDISKKIVKEKLNYKDFLIVSNDIDTYLPYFDLFFNIPYSKKEEKGILTSKFISLFKELLNGNFTCSNFINLLKLDLFDIDVSLIDKLDNYIYSWNLENENFYKEFTFNPNGNKPFNEKDKVLLDELNNAKNDIINPIKYLLENVVKEKNINTILKYFYTYLNEEKIDLKLFEKDEEGYLNLISALEIINEYLNVELSISEVFGLISNLNLKKESSREKIDVIKISNLKNAIYEDKKYIYLVGASEDVLVKNLKLSNLITYTDLTKDFLTILISKNKNDEEYYLNELLKNKNVTITYHKLSVDSKLKDLSKKIKVLDLNKVNLDELYNVNLIKNNYAILLSKDKVNLNDNMYFKNINKSNMHNLNNSLDENISNKLYSNELVLSPSSLETYFKCNFYYFCQYGLKLKIKEKYLFDSRELGTFVHYVLENVIKNGLDNISSVDDEIDKYSKTYLEDNNKIINNKNVFMIKQLAINVKHIINNIINEQKVSKLKPTYFEFKIGNEEIIKPVKLDLNNGSLSIIGNVDRVDTYENNENYYYRIIDYKTGVKKFKLDDIIAGFNLQMLLYLFSIKENKNALTTKEIIPCGFFYYPALLKEVSESRKKTTEQLSEELSNRLKMSGMVNYKSDIIDFDEFGKYSEILTRGKLNEEKIFNMDDLELLFNHIKNILINAGNDILSGNINVNPKEKNNEACMYCKFKSICKFDNDIDKTIKIKNYTNKEVLKKLGGEQDA